MAGCLACALAAAPQQPQQPPPAFRGGVNLVVVDVSVLDRDRSPVRGLTSADFTILEDGKPQAITTFSEIHVPDVVTTTAPWTREVAPDVQDNLDQADRRLLVVVLDNATPMPIGEVPYAREMARRVIERLGPRDLAAVVYVLNKTWGQEFTGDRARLLRALERFKGSTPGLMPWTAFDASVLTMYGATLSTLKGVVESLIDLPGRRKAVVFVSVGLPLDLEPLLPSGVAGEGTSHVQGAAQDLMDQTLDLFRAAQLANVNVYSLDPGGLRVGAGRLNREFLQILSETTGGLPVIDTNDPEPGIAQMFRENGSYYLLGYETPDRQSKGRYRRIDIRVNRPGVTVRARRGYLEPRTAAPSKESGDKAEEPLSPAWRNVASVLPKTDLAVRATAAPFAVPGQADAAVAVVAQVELPVPETAGDFVVDAELLVYAYDMKGKQDEADRTSFRIEATGSPKQTVAHEVLSRLDLKPGTYQLRIGASSSVLGKDGSVYCDVDVPDFSKGPLAVSGVVMSATPGVSSGPTDRLASLLPVVPTTEREFSADQAVTAFLRVYQPGRNPLVPVLVRSRILDGQGAEVFASSDRLDPARFDSARAADYTLSLPVVNLPGSEYLLNLEVVTAPPAAARERTSASRPIRRDVRFAVR